MKFVENVPGRQIVYAVNSVGAKTARDDMLVIRYQNIVTGQYIDRGMRVFDYMRGARVIKSPQMGEYALNKGDVAVCNRMVGAMLHIPGTMIAGLSQRMTKFIKHVAKTAAITDDMEYCIWAAARKYELSLVAICTWFGCAYAELPYVVSREIYGAEQK